MTARTWASTLQCDYPECQSVADVKSQDETPAGWLCLRTYDPLITDMFGAYLRDFCSLHAATSITVLAGALRAKGAKDGQGTG
jgi:hypothetical protein